MTPADDRRHRLLRPLARLTLAVTIGVIAAAGATDGRASAHAVLLAVQPANGAVIAAAPTEVVLTFSEPVSLSGGSARVLDDDASTVSRQPRVEGAEILIPLGPDVGTGTFTVAFEVVSVDSHRISGATVFHVGAPSLSEPVTSPTNADQLVWWVSALALLLSFAAYATVLLAVGLWWFAVFVARELPGQSPLGDRLAGVAERSAALGIVVLVAGLPARIARTAGTTAALADNSMLLDAARGPLGVAAAVGIVGAAMVGAGIASVRHTGGRGIFAAAFGLVALASFLVEGHTRSQQPLGLMIAFDFSHLLAAAIWIGGVAGLVIAFRTRSEPEILASTVSRFSAAAVWAVVLVSSAGVGMASIVLPSPAALTSTGYGVTLLAKVAMVLVVVALGAYNRRALVPRIVGEPSGPARRRLAVTVRVELAVLLVVLALTSVLVTRSPAASTVAAPAGPAVAAAELTNGAGSVTLGLDPGLVGGNTLQIDLLDADGETLLPIEPPLVSLTEPTLDVGPLRPPNGTAELGPGTYEAVVDVPVAGDWDVTVRVRLSEFSVATASVTMKVPRR